MRGMSQNINGSENKSFQKQLSWEQELSSSHQISGRMEWLINRPPPPSGEYKITLSEISIPIKKLLKF